MPSQNFINDYRKMIAVDGGLTKEELIKMLKLDEILTDENKTDEKLSKLADKIIEKKYGRKDYAISPKRKSIYDERMELYQQGLSDSEIARVQQTYRTSIVSWRKSRNLKSNTLSNKEKNRIRMELYLKGYTNKQIAEAENVPLSTITTWTWKNRLTPNGYVVPLKKRYEKSNEGAENV